MASDLALFQQYRDAKERRREPEFDGEVAKWSYVTIEPTEGGVWGEDQDKRPLKGHVFVQHHEDSVEMSPTELRDLAWDLLVAADELESLGA